MLAPMQGPGHNGLQGLRRRGWLGSSHRSQHRAAGISAECVYQPSAELHSTSTDLTVQLPDQVLKLLQAACSLV